MKITLNSSVRGEKNGKREREYADIILTGTFLRWKEIFGNRKNGIDVRQ